MSHIDVKLEQVFYRFLKYTFYIKSEFIWLLGKTGVPGKNKFIMERIVIATLHNLKWTIYTNPAKATHLNSAGAILP